MDPVSAEPAVIQASGLMTEYNSLDQHKEAFKGELVNK